MKLLLLTAIAAVLGMSVPSAHKVWPPAATGPPVPSGTTAAPRPSTINPKPSTLPRTDRDKVIALALTQVGTQERTGHNDGAVDKYLAAVGMSGTKNPYCAAFVYWVGKSALAAKNPFPRSAYSPDFVGSGATSTISRARPGDTFGVYHASKGRVAHTGLVRGLSGRYLHTIEANTSPGSSSGEADRNGDGVWSKLRDVRTIHRIKSWLP